MQHNQTVNSATKEAARSYANQLFLGDAASVLKNLPSGCIDLTVTDPPYLVNYKDRNGRSIMNDVNTNWVDPVFSEVYRVLKNNSLCVSFYGWNKIDIFMAAWRAAGFVPVGHIVWSKRYPSSSRFLEYRHEQAYLLAKGRPKTPEVPLSDVQDWHYSGNSLHPTQKSVKVIKPLITTFSKPGDLILDPFCGSATTAVAARKTKRKYVTIEKDEQYYHIARKRLYS